MRTILYSLLSVCLLVPAVSAQDAILIYVESAGKKAPVGAWKSDLPGVVKDVAAQRLGLARATLVLSASGKALDDAKSLADNGVSAGAVLAASSAQTAAPFQVSVKTLTGKTFTVTVSAGTTVLELKGLVEKGGGPEAGRQRLIFAGKQLDDSITLSEYRIEAGSILYLVIKLTP